MMTTPFDSNTRKAYLIPCTFFRECLEHQEDGEKTSSTNDKLFAKPHDRVYETFSAMVF